MIIQFILSCTGKEFESLHDLQSRRLDRGRADVPVLELGRGADLQVNPRVVEDERKKRHETHGDDFVPGTGCNLAISLKLLSHP